jgi:hypothetical protein
MAGDGGNTGGGNIVSGQDSSWPLLAREPGGGKAAGSTGTGESYALHQAGTSAGPPPIEAGFVGSGGRWASIEPTQAPSPAANTARTTLFSLYIVITSIDVQLKHRAIHTDRTKGGNAYYRNASSR